MTYLKKIAAIGSMMLLAATQLQAQNARFVSEGTIEFEKKVNMYAKIKARINKDNESFMQQAFDQYKRTQPQFKTFKTKLSFSKAQSLFSPIASDDDSKGNGFFGEDPSINMKNLILTDFNTGTSSSLKKIFEEQYLVKDSIRKINWKITDETRQIAGYDCRRANALVMDSIYVVAFYCDQIPVSGGPESFTGLPGMILGLALPHDNTSWFATKVTDAAVAEKDLVLTLPKKVKAVDNKGLKAALESGMKDWGEYGKPIVKAALL
ncbi:GLPGLI family protein [Pedobacter yulinensis]|uniref:GLPGLI family protein n=1 Tax=Pedobacter yulinensis TaxID=2126353 RepID=A0A2T3HRN3_9SPHI|nr:GLPGLI family protein [Pedobacter yulinensis]PST85125.1 GLPGLI family protein [Pedobacter yulinensis]